MRYLYCMSLWASFFTQKNYLKINRMSRINTASNEIVIESSIWIGDIIYAATYTRKPSQSWFIQPLRHSSHRLYLNCTVEHYHKNFLKNFFYSTSSICANCRLGYGLYNSFVQGFFFFFLFFFFGPGHIFKTAACDSRCIPQFRSQRRLPNESSMEKLVRRWDLRRYGRMNEWTDWNEYEKNKNYVPWLSLFRQVIRSMRAGSHAIWLSRIKKQSCARWWHR